MTGGWLFWIIIGATVLQWVVTKMNEQAALNKAKREREQRRLESLRTGQGLSAQTSISPTSAAPQGADIQARRQAQLRALRERQQQWAQRTGAPPTQQQQQAPTRRAQRAPRPQAPQGPRTTPLPSQSQHAQQAHARQLQQQQRLAQQRAEQERRLAAQRAAEQARTVSAGPSLVSIPERVTPVAEPHTAARPAKLGRPQSREEWRRAIIAAEILAPPVSLRPVEQ